MSAATLSVLPSHPPASSSSPNWLSWPGDDVAVLRVLATFLPFSDADVAVPPPSTQGHHSSFLSLARTCRRAYELLTSDAACWSTQQLRFDLREALLYSDDFAPLVLPASYPHRFREALRVDRFTARRQETLRRLMGAAAFEHSVALRMAHISTVSLGQRRVFVVDGSDVARDEDRAYSADVYADLDKIAFKELNTAALTLHQRHPTHASALWLHGGYTHLLLPDCIRLATAAAVTPSSDVGAERLDCLHRLLGRLPAVESLTLERAEPRELTQRVLPEWSWEVLHATLPRLRSLTVLNVPVWWREALRPLMTEELGELRELVIDSNWNMADDEDGWHNLMDDTRMTFHFPTRSHHTTAATADDACGERDDKGDSGAVQRRLRLALCRHMMEHLRGAVARLLDAPMQREELQSLLRECGSIESRLQQKELGSS